MIVFLFALFAWIWCSWIIWLSGKQKLVSYWQSIRCPTIEPCVADWLLHRSTTSSYTDMCIAINGLCISAAEATSGLLQTGDSRGDKLLGKVVTMQNVYSNQSCTIETKQCQIWNIDVSSSWCGCCSAEAVNNHVGIGKTVIEWVKLLFNV